MPTFSAAAMGSLPPHVAGVGSGALNTLRQVGFSLGLAVVVAVFSHALIVNSQEAAASAVAYVQTRTELPAKTRAAISAAILKQADNPQEARAVVSGGSLPGVPAAAPGTPAAAAQAEIGAAIAAIFRDTLARSFAWPFYAAAVAAALAAIPALFTGRRLGEHEGHHELTRAQRIAERQ